MERLQSAPMPRAMPRPLTDVLVVGHLPVRSGLWLTPYADAVAREHGCVGLVRLDGGEPSLQVVRGSDGLEATAAPDTLQQSIAELAGEVNAWIVRPGNADEAVELVAAGSPQVTILTSADEAAVVAAYQVIKNLAQAAQDGDCAVPHVCLAVMGADQSAAETVVERLNRTTVSFLGVEVRLACSLARMDAGIRSTRYQSFSHEPIPALADVLAWVKEAQSVAPRRAGVNVNVNANAVAPNLTPGVIGRVGAAPQPSRRPPLRVEEPLPSQRVASGSDHETPSRAQVVASDAPVRLRPKPAMDVEAKDAVQAREPDDHGRPVALAAHVEGLTPLIVRMPGHEQVEVAVDRTGRMHVLALEGSLRELRVMEAWAFAHRELIAMASAQHFIDQSATVIAHVFTDRPAALADLHGTDLRLHVRAPVVVNGQTGWYAAPLNSPK